MCAITGFLDKTGRGAPIGSVLLRMLLAVGCRGPDSTGVAIYGPPRDGLALQIKVGERSADAAKAGAVLAFLDDRTAVREAETIGPYLRVVIDAMSADIADELEACIPEVEVVSLGRSLRIVKQVGSPQALEASCALSLLNGTHGIGHTRLSTESRIDLSHSQPFWAHGLPDVATAHNGHITNYHQLRRRYEQHGVRFHTENDSEIIGVYLRDRMARGRSFSGALRDSLDDFDGSYCYLAATADEMAFVKDPFGLKPLVVAETDDWVAIATEEIALRQALGEGFHTREPGARSLKVWQVGQLAPV